MFAINQLPVGQSVCGQSVCPTGAELIIVWPFFTTSATHPCTNTAVCVWWCAFTLGYMMHGRVNTGERKRYKKNQKHKKSYFLTLNETTVETSAEHVQSEAVWTCWISMKWKQLVFFNLVVVEPQCSSSAVCVCKNRSFMESSSSKTH